MSIYCPLSEALGIEYVPCEGSTYNPEKTHYFDSSIPSPFKGQKHTEESRKAISEGLKGKTKTEEHKKRLSESAKKASKLSSKPQGRPKGSGKGQIPWHKGKTGVFAEDVLKSKSEKMSGENNPMFGKSAWTGKKHSEETLTKMKEARKLYWMKRRGECV